MPKYVTVNIEENEKNALKQTADKAAAKIGLKKLSLSQFIRIMHEQYKEKHGI